MISIDIIFAASASEIFNYSLQTENHLITVKEAIIASGVLSQYRLSRNRSTKTHENPKLDDDYTSLNDILIGIFSHSVSLSTIVQDGDRIEIYRPLTISPIEARRIRANKKRKEQGLKLFDA